MLDAWVIDEVENKNSMILSPVPFLFKPSKEIQRRTAIVLFPKTSCVFGITSIPNFSYQRNILLNVHGMGTLYSDAIVIDMLCSKSEELTSVKSFNPPPLSAGGFC